MKKLKVDMAELEWAFEDASWEISHYLDLETGEVVMVTDEIRRYLEEPPDRPLLDWQQEWVELAERVEAGYGSRYISVPQDDSRQGYRDMERFIGSVQDDHLREQLWLAISGRGAFRYFKDVLADHPRERERWLDFKNEQVRRRVLDWLESIGIEPIIEPQLKSEEETPPALPPVRERFIAEVLAFVRGASRLPGVTRIALLGSLTTEEPEPEDADVLVTVTDEADLPPPGKTGPPASRPPAADQPGCRRLPGRSGWQLPGAYLSLETLRPRHSPEMRCPALRPASLPAR